MGPYAARIYHHWSTSNIQSTLFILRFSVRPFSGLLASRLLLLWLTWCEHHGWFLPFVNAYFYKAYSKTLDVFLRWLLSLCPMRTVSWDPIFGFPTIFFCPSEMLMIHRPNSSEVLLLSARLAALLGSSCSYFPCYPRLISKILGRTSLRMKGCPRKSFPCLRLFSSVMKKVYWYGFLALRRAYSDGRLSSFSMRKELLM